MKIPFIYMHMCKISVWIWRAGHKYIIWYSFFVFSCSKVKKWLKSTFAHEKLTNKGLKIFKMAAKIPKWRPFWHFFIIFSHFISTKNCPEGHRNIRLCWIWCQNVAYKSAPLSRLICRAYLKHKLNYSTLTIKIILWKNNCLFSWLPWQPHTTKYWFKIRLMRCWHAYALRKYILSYT